MATTSRTNAKTSDKASDKASDEASTVGVPDWVTRADKTYLEAPSRTKATADDLFEQVDTLSQKIGALREKRATLYGDLTSDASEVLALDLDIKRHTEQMERLHKRAIKQDGNASDLSKRLVKDCRVAKAVTDRLRDKLPHHAVYYTEDPNLAPPAGVDGVVLVSPASEPRELTKPTWIAMDKDSAEAQGHRVRTHSNASLYADACCEVDKPTGVLRGSVALRVYPHERPAGLTRHVLENVGWVDPYAGSEFVTEEQRKARAILAAGEPPQPVVFTASFDVRTTAADASPSHDEVAAPAKQQYDPVAASAETFGVGTKGGN